MGRLAEFKPVAQTETKSKFEGLIDRNHNGAPIIWPEDTDPEAVAKWRASGATIKDRDARLRPKGGKAYSRTTKFIDVVDDKEGLIRWLNRKTLLGAALTPGLGAKVIDVEDPDSREGKALLDRYVKEAQDSAHADLKALAGTSIHEVFEDYDEGRDTGFLLDEVQVLLDAYKVATKDLEMVGVELFGVEDTYEVAGTLDRLAYEPLTGRLLVADNKTGSIAGVGKIARQLAFYAHMKRYDPQTFERTPYTYNGLEVDRERALIIHAPSDGDYCNVYEVNIAEAWQDIETCRAIYDIRNKWSRKAFEPRLVSSSRSV